MNSVLDHMASKRHHYIHGGGRKATQFLISLMQLSGQERILEIGFGTGSTSVTLLSQYPEIEYFGIEVNENMLNVASKRLKFCGINNYNLRLLQDADFYPFNQDQVDVIFFESVVGILNKDQLLNMFDEIHKLLKPGGKLFLNETMWCNQVILSEAQSINKYVKSLYGILQAQEYLLHEAEYIKCISDSGFKLNHSYKVDLLDYFPTARNIKELKSSLFTFIGRLNSSSFRPKRPLKVQNETVKSFINHEKKYLEAIVMSFEKI